MLAYFKNLFNKYSIYLAIFLTLIYGLAGSIVSVIRFWQYDVFYYDFGIFDRAIWEVSRFQKPIIDHMILGGKIIFADHFSPSIFIASPFFWIFPQSETLLVIQAFMAALSGLVLFFIGRHVLKNNLYSLVLMLCYFLFTGLQNAVITDFHEVTVATFFFMLNYLFLVKKKTIGFFISFLILLGFKETMFLVGIGIAISILFIQFKWKKIAFITFIISIIWGLLTIKLIIPYFSGGVYLYASEIPTNVFQITSSFFNDPLKRHTLFFSFLSFGFLPILSPAFWFLLFQDFLTRFYGPYFTRWGLGFHYSALTSSIMAVSSIFSLQWIKKFIKPVLLTIFMILILFISIFLYRFILRGPFALSYNKTFYEDTKQLQFLDKAIKLIPKNATIMTQNNIAPHFTHQKVYLLISDMKLYRVEYYTTKMPDYILIDNRSGQNPNDFFGVQDMKLLLSHLEKDKNYQQIDKNSGVLIFKRVHDSINSLSKK